MSQAQPPLAKLDAYIADTFAREDDALTQARADMKRENLPAINVSATEGKTLHALALLIGARRILEIGTLGGYSAIWLARALPPDGKLVSLELDPHHADVARRNIARAGLASVAEVRVGPALVSLDQMIADGEPLFDLAFIDADKPSYPAYLQRALKLVRVGGVILADNTLPDAVLSATETSGAKEYNARAAADPNLASIVLPMLRTEGLDGLTVSVRRR